MWWNAHAVPLTRAWWNAPFFWPMPDALALTEHLAGLSPIATPIQLLGGSPLLAYNLVLIASTWWSALATHALLKRLTGNTAAAACAGIAFAFAPYRTGQLGHLQLYACWWLPLALLALHAYIESGRRRWLVVFGASWLLQALTNGYMMFFVPVLLAAWVAWFTPWRTHAKRGLAIAVTWFLFSLPLVPMLREYYQVQTRLGLGRDRAEMIFYSATRSSFLSATPLLRFWHTPAPATTEVYLFPGVTVVVLILLALAARVRSRTFVFYAGGAVMAAWLCIGPSREPFSVSALWHPYDWLIWLPGFSGLRVPARFFMLCSLCLGIAAGLALAHLRTLLRHAAILGCLVFAGLAVDGAIAGMPLGVPPGNLGIVERGARVLALPFDDAYATIRAMYQSMTHRLAVVNGYAGYVPPHAEVILWALRRRDPTVLTELRRGHPLYVIVMSSDEALDWTRFMESQPGVEMLGVSGGGRVFKLPPSAFAREIRTGPVLAVSSVTAIAEDLIVDLGAPQTVRSVEVRTFRRLTRLPPSVRIETSSDGSSWTLEYDDRPGGAALNGALAEPLVVPLRLLLNDVRTRYLRINTAAVGRQTVSVYGPP